MAREFAKSFYRSKEWKAVRDFCLKRDKYLCVKCGKPTQEVHHIIHLSPTNIWDETITLNPSNLQCLCKQCHFDQHKGEHAKGLQTDKPQMIEYRFDENGMIVQT